jgi:hypothetical protein
MMLDQSHLPIHVVAVPPMPMPRGFEVMHALRTALFICEVRRDGTLVQIFNNVF